MYTQGQERARMESANQMRLQIKNNTQGVTACDAAWGLSIDMVASNRHPLPIHFNVSHCLGVMDWLEREDIPRGYFLWWGRFI